MLNTLEERIPFLARPINTVTFAIAYALLMVPTYVLPFLGSTSHLTQGLVRLASSRGIGPFPPTWVHLWFLGALILVAYMRGNAINKPYLIAFSILAALFDMTPVLNLIPFAPTGFHLITLVLGIVSPSQVSHEAEIKAARGNILALKWMLGVSALCSLGIAINLVSVFFSTKPSAISWPASTPPGVAPPVTPQSAPSTTTPPPEPMQTPAPPAAVAPSQAPAPSQNIKPSASTKPIAPKPAAMTTSSTSITSTPPAAHNAQRNLPGMMSQQTTGNTRYYCEASKQFFPQASECPSGWTTVGQ